MNLLKKENWWVWLILAFLSGGTSILVLGALLNVYHKDTWYYRWVKKAPKIVIIGFAFLFGIATLASTFVLPYVSISSLEMLDPTFASVASILLFLYLVIEITIVIFQIQIACEVNAKLKTPGNEIYLSPYIWILGLVIPIIGWILLIVMILYLQIWYLVMLYRGEGEKGN